MGENWVIRDIFGFAMLVALLTCVELSLSDAKGMRTWIAVRGPPPISLLAAMSAWSINVY
jgi:hypothetical protein